VTRTGAGSSIWNHMPGCCAVPAVSHRAPGVVPSALAAASGLWLAESFHSVWFANGFGSDASSSGSVHIVFLADALRTAAT
jgi:hypothetical protein